MEVLAILVLVCYITSLGSSIYKEGHRPTHHDVDWRALPVYIGLAREALLVTLCIMVLI